MNTETKLKSIKQETINLDTASKITIGDACHRLRTQIDELNQKLQILMAKYNSMAE